MLAFKDTNITINTQHYCGAVRDRRTAFKKKRPRCSTRGVIVLHYNARPHVTRTVQDTQRSMSWKVMDHPPYKWTYYCVAFMCSAPSRKRQRAVDSSRTTTSRLGWCRGSSSSPRNSLRRGFVSWCVNGMPVLTSMRTILTTSAPAPSLIPELVSFEQAPYI